MQAVFEHLSESLHRELDFRREAENIYRMGSVIEDFTRLRVPVVHADYSTSRLLVMQDIGGGPAASAPEGRARRRPLGSCSSPSTSRSSWTASSTPTRIPGT